MDPLVYDTKTVNGVELEVAVANPGGERGLALLVHGFPESAFSWRFQIPMLAEMGYEVWAPNTRGYRNSDKPPKVSDYSIDHLLDDLGALIDLSGHERVTLMAHDWGAIQAWMFAIRKVRPLERLVIMNVPHPTCGQRELRRFRQLRKSWYIFAFQIPKLPEWALLRNDARPIAEVFTSSTRDPNRFPPEITDEFRRSAQRPGAMTAMVNYYRALVRGARTARKEVLAPVDTPTLMIWGEEDVALSKETTDGTDEYVRNLTLRFLPGVSHWVQQESPEEVNTMLAAWLNDEPVPEADEIRSARLPDPALH